MASSFKGSPVTKTKIFLAWVLILAAASPALMTSAPADNHTYDVLFINGQVLDGTGNPWFYADVAVKDGRIAAVGHLKDRAESRPWCPTSAAAPPSTSSFSGRRWTQREQDPTWFSSSGTTPCAARSCGETGSGREG